MEYYAVTDDSTYFNLGVFTGDDATDDAVNVAFCILGDDYKQLSGIVTTDELKQSIIKGELI